jgi:16S rRNA (guanine527-N7)-methyltransferase
VSVHAARAEDAARGPLRNAAGRVTARAVAALPELLEYTAPFARPGGLLALPKGTAADEELAAAGGALQALGCVLTARLPMRPAISETLSVLLFEVMAPTEARYPRRPGMPAKRPL